MSAITATPEAARSARTGLAMSVATFTMAAASALQAVLYLSEFGASGRTDGFFVAFALYTTFGVFSQSLRLTSVPLLIGDRPRLSPTAFAVVLGTIAVPLLIATGPLAGPLAGVLAPGLSAVDRAVTADALPLLGFATVLQLWAAGAATLLAIRDRFMTVAASYVGGSAAGLATYLALERSAGELVLAWSMLAMAIVTCAIMLSGLRASGGLGGALPRLRAVFADIAVVFGRTAIYLAVNMLFIITLAAASTAAAGDATVLSYAYLFASYLVAGTGMALGMSRIPDMTRAANTERRSVIEDNVPPGFRYAMMVVAPALAGLVAAGASLIHAVLPHSLDAAGVRDLRVFAALLVAWTVAALLVSFLLPVMFALGRARLVNLLAIPLVLVHVGATLVGSALFGVEGAIAAFAIAPALFAIVLLVSAAGRDEAWPLGRRLGADALRFGLLAAASFGAAAAIAAPVGNGLAGAALAAITGCALYACGLMLTARDRVRALLVALRPAAG